MKRIGILFLVLLLAVTFIAGCSSNSPAATTTGAPTTTAAPPASTSVATAATARPAGSPTGGITVNPPTTSSTATKPAPAGTQKYGGVLIDIEAGGPGGPIGWPPELAAGAGVSGQIGLDQLLHEDRTGKITPNLAESFEIVTDPANPSITFKLRKGVKFHDGTDFNAQAVKWNLDNIKTGVNPSVTSVWKSWEVVDDYTVRIVFNTWQNTLVRNFTGISLTMSSPTAYKKNGLDWSRYNIVGTGAFKQVDFVNEVRLVTTRFSDYWEKGKPYLDGLTMLYVADPMTRVALFKSGGGDVMAVTAKDANDLKISGYKIIQYPASANALIPDSANPESPWSNTKVRMAAEHALDKEALSRAFGYGYNPPAYQLAPYGTPAVVPTITGRKYDVAKAKQLLAEAGFPNGFKSKIIALTTGDRDLVTAVQAYFKTVGIQVDLDFADPGRFASLQLGTWNNGLMVGGLRPFPNFNADLTLEFGLPTTFYKPVKKPDGWQDILKATLTSKDADPALMQKATQALYDDCTMIPTTYSAGLWVTQPYVYDTGRGEMGSQTQFRPYDTWISR